jgi:two-component system, sensor histidine kinase and response regulator
VNASQSKPPEEEPSSGRAEAEVLDPLVIANLRALGEATGRDLLASLVDEFLNVEAPASMRALREAIGAADSERARSAAHRLRGTSAALGAARLADASEDVETQGRAGQLSGMADLFERVEVEASLAFSALAACASLTS